MAPGSGIITSVAPAILRISSVLLTMVLLAGCARVPANTPAPAPSQAVEAPVLSTPGEIHWPGDDWPTAQPEARGLDPQRLAALAADAPQRAPNLSSLLVIRNGDVVLEQYYGSRSADDTLEIYSVTKSFISTLVGIAIDQGLIQGVEVPVLSFFPEREIDNPDPDKERLTLDQVLSMSTGFKWSEDDIDRLYTSPDWAQFMLDLPVVEPPGSRFNYCTGCSHLLSAIIQQSSGMETLAFARQYLFEPIGIRQVTWLSDSQGLAIGGWGLQLTPRDMARLGYLYLRQGNWDGRQVVSEKWVQAATSDHMAVGDNPKVRYGYQWWVRPSMNGYAATGRGGQMIAVIPDKDLVVVFTANGVDHEVEYKLIEEYLLPAVR